MIEQGHPHRLERLRALGETFWYRYGDGSEEYVWPDRPGRYAVKVYSERYGEFFWKTVESLDEVGLDAVRIHDLDDDVEIPFTVKITFGDDGSARETA